ncbi:hypothetical protein [Candidatus Ruminimicrobium bovinum]|uniref:hypothetical protein n=1 Tax=Candidatus Ruminimicrobium bovinum TaxID=3242779 RepID=UPI0039B9CE4C
MFSVVSIASLISLGVVLAVFFAAKIVRPGISFESIHYVLAALVFLFSTVAGSMALVNVDAKKALDEKIIEPTSHVSELPEKMHKVLSVWRIFDSRVPDLIESLPNRIDSLMDERVAPARAKLNRAIWIHSIVFVLINILFFVILISSGGRSRRYSDESDSRFDDLDDFSPSGTGYSFDDSDF